MPLNIFMILLPKKEEKAFEKEDNEQPNKEYFSAECFVKGLSNNIDLHSE